MGLSIVAGLIAVIGGANPWAYRSVIGVMGFVVLDFTYETRFYAYVLWDKSRDGHTTALVLVLAPGFCSS